jgi:hypothetical protein
MYKSNFITNLGSVNNSFTFYFQNENQSTHIRNFCICLIGF